MKSILVIETPTNCYECPLIYWGNIGGWNCKPTRALLDDANGKPEWCPLRPLPQKIEGKREKFMPTYSLGWNDCLDAVELGLKPLWEKTE